jgi:hypothetical protein
MDSPKISVKIKYLSAEMMILANVGPQVATEVKGASRKSPLFLTASQENPNPQVIAKVLTKKAITW